MDPKELIVYDDVSGINPQFLKSIDFILKKYGHVFDERERLEKFLILFEKEFKGRFIDGDIAKIQFNHENEKILFLLNFK